MLIAGLLLFLGAPQQPLKAPTFSAPQNHTLSVPRAAPPPPKLDAPDGYRIVRVPDYIASTYMNFARTETAHDFQISSVENRVGSLEAFRDKTDRPDIDSLKDTRSKALIYLTVGSTLWTVVWGLFAAFLGYIFKEHVMPRLRFLWNMAGAVRQSSWPVVQGIQVTASADDEKKEGQSD